MGVFDFLSRKKAGREVHMDWYLRKGQFVVDEDRSQTYIDKGYKALPNLYGIVSLIIQKSSIVPPEVFQIKDKQKYQRYKAQMQVAQTPKDYARALLTKSQSMEKVENSELEALLLKPNLYQSMTDLNESFDGYLLLTGNAYMYGMTTGLSNSGGKPSELHSLIAPSVTIKAGESWRNPVEGYTLSYMSQDVIPADEVGHAKNWNPLSTYNTSQDLLYGLSPLKSARRLLGKYKEADIAQGSMFQNMGVSGILSGTDGNLQEPQARALQDKWKQLYGGSQKAGDIAITSANVQWHQIGLSPVDLNIIEGKEEILGELCNIYHVPIGMFTKTNSTENNMVESRKMFITDGVIPLVEKRKQIINRWLAPKFGDNIVVEYDYSIFNELSDDITKLSESLSKMWWLTLNEKRQASNYDTDTNPDANKYYLPSGLSTLEDVNGSVPDIDPANLDPDNL